MSEYPHKYESDVVLRDGVTVRLRPIRPDDAPQLLALHNGLSLDSLYLRFFAVPRLNLERMQRLADVDYQDDFALVAEWNGGIGAIVAFYRDRTAPHRAEIAFTVMEGMQGHGVGTRLLERLASIARERDVSVFDAYVLADNRKMMQLFLDSGFRIERRMEEGVYHVTLSLEETPLFQDRAAGRSQQAATASVKVFFEPQTVAVVGANRRRGTIGGEIFHNLRDRFTGTVIPVNPNAASIDGVTAYPALTDIPTPVDLAVIVVPAVHVSAVVDDCLAKGVKGLVVISAGFAETGGDGALQEAALIEKVRRAGIRMIGPNCMGVLNTDPAFQLNATFSPVYPPEGRVAMSTQSGALGLAILDYASRLNIGISTFVSVGNKADVSGNDLIQYWAGDPRTDVILLYLESFGNPRNFSRIARRVARQKPIVAVKAGRSSAGARAAASHTGALATSDAIVDALLLQAGVIRTRTLEEMFDVAALLAQQPPPQGPRVAVLTNAGGPGILAADACEAGGLQLPTLGDATREALRAFLPAAASVGNPVDMIASASADDYGRAMGIILADEAVDSLLVIFIPPLVTATDDVARAIVNARRSAPGKTVLASFMSARGAPAALAPVPCYVFPESAATALARATKYGAWRRTPAGDPVHFADARPDEARSVVREALARGGGWLTPIEAQRVLDAYAIPVARAAMAASEDESVACARAVGLPVAMKAVGPTIVHKTEEAGVRLDLGDEAAVRGAYRDLAGRLGPRLTGVLVQKMVRGGVEMMIGAVHEPTFGPVIACGTGGVLVDVLSDTSFRLPPLTDADAAAMVDELKGAVLLRGYRGAPPADQAALRDVLLRASALIDACPEIQEMDLNPVKVLDHGVRVVDVRMRVDRPASGPPSRRIAY